MHFDPKNLEGYSYCPGVCMFNVSVDLFSEGALASMVRMSTLTHSQMHKLEIMVNFTT